MRNIEWRIGSMAGMALSASFLWAAFLWGAPALAAEGAAAAETATRRPPFAGNVCPKPDRPTFPDGTTATAAEMEAAEKAVRNYLAMMDRYLGCVNYLDMWTSAGAAGWEMRLLNQDIIERGHREQVAVLDALREVRRAYDARLVEE